MVSINFQVLYTVVSCYGLRIPRCRSVIVCIAVVVVRVRNLVIVHVVVALVVLHATWTAASGMTLNT